MKKISDLRAEVKMSHSKGTLTLSELKHWESQLQDMQLRLATGKFKIYSEFKSFSDLLKALRKSLRACKRETERISKVLEALGEKL